MNKAIRESIIVAASSVATLVIWVALRLLLAHAGYRLSTLNGYILVFLLYAGIRFVIRLRYIPR